MQESIHNIKPLDLSGRHARNGFAYQDHVGAMLCIDMVLNPNISQIWFETEDDLTIIWEENGEQVVEFVQVKNLNLPSRWSPSVICQKGTDGDKQSIVETSLLQDRCKEKSLFRVVSSYDVNDSLEVLKYPLGSQFRKDAKEKEKDLIDQLVKKLGNVKSKNNNGIDYWVENCYWQKLSDTTEGLEALNIQNRLTECLKKVDLNLFQEQYYELYQRLLGEVKKASNSDLKLNPNVSKIRRDWLISWLREQVDALRSPKAGTDRLVEKMKSAGFDQTMIDLASDLKWQFKTARLDVDYLGSSELLKLEEKLSGVLFAQLVKLDSGKLQHNPQEFLDHCLEIVNNELKVSFPNVKEIIGQGYIFERTNRCLHRFKEASQ